MKTAASRVPVRVPVPVIIVRRVYFAEYLAGTKTIEYRRHRRPFTSRVFYPGRRVGLADVDWC